MIATDPETLDDPIKDCLDGGISISAEGSCHGRGYSADQNRDGFYFEWIKGRQNVTWKPISALKNKGGVVEGDGTGADRP